MKIFILLIALCLAPPLTFAQTKKSASGGRYDFQKRADVRTQKRWTLQDWLDGKERSQMMDLWLAMNSPSPYEFMIGGVYNSYGITTTANPVREALFDYAGSLAAYAQFVGVGAEYENNTKESYNDLTGLAHIRVWGNSMQSSALTLSYGLRTRNGMTATNQSYRLNQQFGDAHLQIYLQKHFGIEGRYRAYLPDAETTLGDTKADLTEGGAFIDFSAFRVYGTWFQERTMSTLNNVESKTDKNGIRTGFKIFF